MCKCALHWDEDKVVSKSNETAQYVTTERSHIGQQAQPEVDSFGESPTDRPIDHPIDNPTDKLTDNPIDEPTDKTSASSLLLLYSCCCAGRISGAFLITVL